MAKAVVLLAAFALLAALIAILYVFDPAASSFYPPCIFKAMTGLLCAGCGATRAAHQLLHGNIAEALRLNAMFVLTAPFIAAGSAVEAQRMMHGSRSLVVQRPWIAWAFVAVLIAWAIARNIIGI